MTQAFVEQNSTTHPGTVTIWTGLLSNIPDGWAVCDGNNGTPNMLDRFSKGAKSGNSSGTTGGQASVTLNTDQLPSHTHSGSTTTDGSHTHKISAEGDVTSGGVSNDYLDSNGSNSHSTNTAGSHTHSFSTGWTGGDGSFENRPPFYEVAFIMKL